MQHYLFAFVIGPLLAAQPVDLVLYAATDAGVFRSRDTGRTWQKTSEGLENLRIAQVVAGMRNDGRIAYAATDAGVFKTSDGGEKWTKSFNEVRVTSIAVDPADEQRVYAAADGKLWASSNGGLDWTPIVTPFPSGVVTVDPYSSRRLYLSATHNYDRTFATTTDRGETWQSSAILPAVRFLVPEAGTPGRLYAPNVTLQQSNDYGQTWIPLGPNPQDLYGVLPDGAHFASLRSVNSASPDALRPGDVHTCIEASWIRYDDPENILGPFVGGIVPGWASYVSGLWIAGMLPGDQPCIAAIRLAEEDATLYASGTNIFRRNGLLSRKVDTIADLGSRIRSLVVSPAREQ